VQNETVDYYTINHKRVAEVWMDEYKECVYRRNPNRWRIDAGNLTVMLNLKRKLQCKPFKYFVDNIGPGKVENLIILNLF
jgi:polypeptide N-acetylgalactosaminyltransferase